MKHATPLLPLLALLLGCQEPPPEEPTPTPQSAALRQVLADDDDSAAPPPQPATLAEREGIPHHDARFHDHLEEAALAALDGDRSEAIDQLRRAVFDMPDSGLAWMQLGEAYERSGYHHRAVECSSEALRHDDDLFEAHLFLARHWLDQGEPKRARRHAERADLLDPEDYRGSYLRSRVYLGLSMWREAIRQSRRAIARQPTAVSAYNNLGFAALQVGENAMALRYLEAAQELDGVQPYMLNNLGVAYERSNRHGDALAAYGQAAAMDPGYTKAIVNRDRVREIVDRQIADEVAAFLAAQSPQLEEPPASAEVVAAE